MQISMSEFIPKWVSKNKIVLDKKSIKIFEFYVINTPCDNVSSRGTDMKKLGWSSNKELKILYEYMIEKVGLVKDKNIITVSNSGNIGNSFVKLKLNGEFYKNVKDSRFCYINDKGNLMSMLFYIRCALAHGRFAINESGGRKMYVLENIKNYNKKLSVKARFVIDEKILLDWIDIISSNKKTVENDISKIKKDIENKIKTFININIVKTESEILDYINSNINSIYRKTVLDEMKNSIIKYDRTLKQWIVKE